MTVFEALIDTDIQESLPQFHIEVREVSLSLQDNLNRKYRLSGLIDFRRDVEFDEEFNCFVMRLFDKVDTSKHLEIYVSDDELEEINFERKSDIVEVCVWGFVEEDEIFCTSAVMSARHMKLFCMY